MLCQVLAFLELVMELHDHRSVHIDKPVIAALCFQVLDESIETDERVLVLSFWGSLP